jgi:hypothetical protein
MLYDQVDDGCAIDGFLFSVCNVFEKVRTYDTGIKAFLP